MKKLLQNNQVIITALAIMIAIAGYLNFSNTNSEKIGISGEFYETSEEVIAKDAKKVDKEETNDEVKPSAQTVGEEKNNIGDAVLVNSNVKLDYFYTVKLDREQTRAKNKEELTKVVENDSLTEEEKEVAVNKIIELTSNSERENSAEMMLEAKGFKNNVVSIVDDNADVVVDKESITAQEVAQIVDIVNRKTGIEICKIVVTPVNTKKNN